MFGVLLEIDACNETESNCAHWDPCRSSQASNGCRLRVELIPSVFKNFAATRCVDDRPAMNGSTNACRTPGFVEER
jgi:hypothetical protein